MVWRDPRLRAGRLLHATCAAEAASHAEQLLKEIAEPTGAAAAEELLQVLGAAHLERHAAGTAPPARRAGSPAEQVLPGRAAALIRVEDLIVLRALGGVTAPLVGLVDLLVAPPRAPS